MPDVPRRNDAVRPLLPTRTAGPLSVRTTVPPARAHDVQRGHQPERRDLTSRLKLLRRVQMEYYEMPGLRLTLAQARRLFGLRDEVCRRVLDALVAADVLEQDWNGAYARKRTRH